MRTAYTYFRYSSKIVKYKKEYTKYMLENRIAVKLVKCIFR
jgi:hypothetical protein